MSIKSDYNQIPVTRSLKKKNNKINKLINNNNNNNNNNNKQQLDNVEENYKG